MSTNNELSHDQQQAQDLINSTPAQQPLTMGYTWEDLSPECKAIAINLADLLQISKTEAYSLLVEKMELVWGVENAK